MPAIDDRLRRDIARTVAWALDEDIGSGDITAELIPAGAEASATIITRESAVLCGRPWVDEVFRQLDPDVHLEWQVADGDTIAPDQILVKLRGHARSLLTGERTALNFLQTLSGTATTAREYADLVTDSGIRVLDTRKTLPGLRSAQKYAVRCGGCHNHRQGLFDAYLIKENHIAACGGIAAAVTKARELHPDRPVEVEVENLDELEQALTAGCDVVMLDEFNAADRLEATRRAAGRAKVEVSGNISGQGLEELARAPVDFVSSGALTKHCRAVDLSMRLTVT